MNFFDKSLLCGFLGRENQVTLNEKICLFDSKTIDTLNWPSTEDAEYTKKFLAPIIKNGIASYIKNIQADVYALKVDSFVFPITVTNENYQNSWVCSPYGQYIGYGKEHTQLIDNKFLAKLVKSLLAGFGSISRAGRINSVVYVNNWLFSTDLYPKGINEDHISLMVSYLREHFPKHAIVFRSLNPLTNSSLIQALQNTGFHLLASRQVHLTDTRNEEIFQRRIVKSDLKLLRESPYEIIDESKICRSECDTLLNLYRLLYIVQHLHSHLQPNFNLNYVEHIFDQGILNFKVLKHAGQIKGVAGYFERGGVMLCPFFGYDKEDPEHNAIYRCLSTSLLMEAKKRGVIFHQSAGASTYKSIRRAESCLESIAFYSKHLPAKQKLFWTVLKTFINATAPRYMKKY